jgi:hypothetical protein
MSAARGVALVLAIVLAAAPTCLAQPAPNIAGSYRGLMTTCLSSPRLADCRNGLFVLVRLADDVDAKRAIWERAVATGGASTDQTMADYKAAVDTLNQAVISYNRDMRAEPR